MKANVIAASRSLRGDFILRHSFASFSGNTLARLRQYRAYYTPKAGGVKNRQLL
jgi:hypothetical protein